MRMSDAPFSAGKTLEFLVVVATILFTKSVGTHLKGASLTWNLIPSFIVLIDLSITSMQSSASRVRMITPWKLSCTHSNCRSVPMHFTLKTPSTCSFVTFFIDSTSNSFVIVFRRDEVLNFTFSDAVCRKGVLLTNITSISSLIEICLSNMNLVMDVISGVVIFPLLLVNEILSFVASCPRVLLALLASTDNMVVFRMKSLLRHLLNFLSGMLLIRLERIFSSFDRLASTVLNCDMFVLTIFSKE